MTKSAVTGVILAAVLTCCPAWAKKKPPKAGPHEESHGQVFEAPEINIGGAVLVVTLIGGIVAIRRERRLAKVKRDGEK